MSSSVVVAIAVAISVAGISGCGSSSDDDGGVFVDAMPPRGSIDAGDPTSPCNAADQTGCEGGEKCGFILDDPVSGLGHTGCIADGSVPIGEPCMEPEVEDRTDTCAAGGYCLMGICHGICTVPDAACREGYCVDFGGLDFNVCLRACDLLAQDCPRALGCFVLFGDGEATCWYAGPVPIGSQCFDTPDCAPGGTCVAEQGICARYCSLAACPPQTDAMGNVVAWCGPGAEPACSCSGGGEGSGMQCGVDESCQGVNADVGACVDLGAGAGARAMLPR